MQFAYEKGAGPYLCPFDRPHRDDERPDFCLSDLIGFEVITSGEGTTQRVIVPWKAIKVHLPLSQHLPYNKLVSEKSWVN